MNSLTLHHITKLKQDSQDGKFTMQGLALTSLIHNLIREQGKYYQGSYVVDIDTLPLSDKRLLLSHFESASWYEYVCKSPTNTQVLFDEHKDHIQTLINSECDEVYREDMEEMGECI